MADRIEIDYEPENLPPGSVVITAPALIAYGEPTDTSTSDSDTEEN